MNAAEIDILALTSDEQLLQALHNAVHGTHRIHQAGDPAGAAVLAAGNLVGVLVTDLALDRLAEILPTLDLHAPGLVTIAAGDRDHGGELLQLNSSGPIFRFLLKPVSTGQLRLYVEAAVKHHIEVIERGPWPLSLNAPPPQRPAPPRRSLQVAAGLSALAMLGAWLLITRPQEVALGARDPAAAQGAPGAEIGRLLADARRAEREERLVDPPGHNALDLYLRILALDPNQIQASRRLAAIADRMFERAESALAEGRLDVARQAIADAKRALPGHPRLAYFGTRLEVEEQRAMILQAFRAAGSGDIGEAAGLIEEAAQVRLGESGAVVEARAELARRAEAEERVDAYLLLAGARTSENRLVEPAEDSALYYVEAARQAGARAGEIAPAIDALVAGMAAESAAAARAERFDAAAAWVEQARRLAPESARVEAMQGELAAAVARAERLRLGLALALERLDGGRLIEPAGDSAAYHLTLLREEAPDHPGLPPALERLAGALADKALAAIAVHALDDAARQLEAARALRVAAPELARAEAAYAAARSAESRPEPSAPVLAALVRRRYVAPEYPVIAQRRQLEGRVELELTVDAAGKVKSVEVMNAQPGTTFEKAAVAAAEQWEYEPAVVDGAPVEARTLVAIDFSLE